MPIDQCDGVFGDITETKVLDFQKLRGIKEDGRVGYITKVELYKYILSNFQ